MKVAVIPARGGSKRIPRKNVRLFAGRPMLSYPIEAAKSSGAFDRIVVSTDDPEIAKIAIEYGAEVPFVRPAELADDHSSSDSVIKHAIDWLRNEHYPVSLVCGIYPTTPLLRSEDLLRGLAVLQGSASQYAFSVTSYDYPIQRALRSNNGTGVAALFPEYIASRSQDLEPAFHDAGQFYWGHADAFLAEIEIFSAASAPVHLPRWRVVDIDTEEDWTAAEIIFEAAARRVDAP